MKRLITILVLLMAISAWGATDYIPLKWIEGAGNDPPDEVKAYVTLSGDTALVAASVSLTRSTETVAMGLWYDSVSVTIGEWYQIVYVAVWSTGDDTIRSVWAGMVEDPADYATAIPDSTANDIAMMGNQHPADSALQEQIYARTDSIADTMNAHAPHDDNWGGTGNAAGTGAVSDTIFALDTSGTPGHVNGVYIEARNSSGTLLGEGATNGSGYVVLGLPQSTAVTLTGFLPGYTWHDTTWTTTSGTTDSDTIKGYDYDVGTASATNLCRVSGHLYTSFGTPISNALVKFCTVQEGAARSGTLIVIPSCKSVPTDVLGAFVIDVMISDSTVYPSQSEKHTYDIEAIVPTGRKNEYKTVSVKEGVEVPAATTYEMELYLNP